MEAIKSTDDLMEHKKVNHENIATNSVKQIN